MRDWWFLAFVVGVTAVATILHEKAYQIAWVILLLPFLAASNRRLNDAGHSPWWQLFWLVPFGQIVVLILLAKPNHGQPGSEHSTRPITKSVDAA